MSIQQDIPIPFDKLNIGDIVKFNVTNTISYVYLGKGRFTWNVKIYKAVELAGLPWWERNPETDTILSSSDRQDTLTNHLFVCLDSDASEFDKFKYWLTGEAILTGFLVDNDITIDAEFIALLNKIGKAWVPDRILSEQEQSIRRGKVKQQYIEGSFVSYEKM